MWGIVPGKGHETGRWHAAVATHAPKWAITAATVETRAAVEAPAGAGEPEKKNGGFLAGITRCAEKWRLGVAA